MVERFQIVVVHDCAKISDLLHKLNMNKSMCLCGNEKKSPIFCSFDILFQQFG